MPIYTYALGPHLKVHSANATQLDKREPGTPESLIVVCHGVCQVGTASIQVPPNIPSLRFAVPHGAAHEIDRQWFESLIKDGVSLEYDFKYAVDPGTQVVNYHLGKGSPDMEKGAAPAQWLSYRKEDRLPKPYGYSDRSIAKTEVLSSSYVHNIMLFADKIGKPLTFDFATLKRTCNTLQDVFQSVATCASIPYRYLLCAFCRELV